MSSLSRSSRETGSRSGSCSDSSSPSSWAISLAHSYSSTSEWSGGIEASPNVAFYLGRTRSRPNGARVGEMLAHWAHDYARLERHHGYIQFLFPLMRARGMNHRASRLTHVEAAYIRGSLECSRRVLDVYRMMLGFYGLRLANARTGRVERSAEYRARFRNLLKRPHNNLRLTRMLISLRHLGFARYVAPLVARLEYESSAGMPLERLARTVREHYRALLAMPPREYARRTGHRSDDDSLAAALSALDREASSSSC